jgi:hypothetical protein
LLFYFRGKPLSISIFHPRWFLDGPAVVQSWRMLSSSCTVESSSITLSPTSATGIFSYLRSHSAGRRHQDNNTQLIIDTTTKTIEKLRSLLVGQKETFISGFCDLTSRLHSRTDEIVASRKVLPTELPLPLSYPNILFKANRRQGYTGRETTEEEEKETRRVSKQIERESELRRIKNEAISQDLRRGHIARHKAEEACCQESENNNNNDFVPATYPPESSTSIQVLATALTSTIRSTLRTSRKPTKRFELQNTRDIAAVEFKEQRKKDKEAKTNRTSTSRTKEAEALAQTSQLLNSIELPFHSS